MNGLTNDLIAIDANVFEHLLNPQENTNGHIGDLLQQLIKDKIRLLVDDKDKIVNEYKSCLLSYMEKTTVDEGKAERIILRYWLLPQNKGAIHEIVLVNQLDDLMTAITELIPPTKRKDRFYVYVAFKKGRVLVTNDHKDIVDHKAELKRKTKSFRLNGADIVDSREAYNRL